MFDVILAFLALLGVQWLELGAFFRETPFHFIAIGANSLENMEGGGLKYILCQGPLASTKTISLSLWLNDKSPSKNWNIGIFQFINLLSYIGISRFSNRNNFSFWLRKLELQYTPVRYLKASFLKFWNFRFEIANFSILSWSEVRRPRGDPGISLDPTVPHLWWMSCW